MKMAYCNHCEEWVEYRSQREEDTLQAICNECDCIIAEFKEVEQE